MLRGYARKARHSFINFEAMPKMHSFINFEAMQEKQGTASDLFLHILAVYEAMPCFFFIASKFMKLSLAFSAQCKANFAFIV